MTKTIACLTLVACLAIQAKAEDASTNRIGYIMCGNSNLVIADAAASWNPKTKEMNIYLSPYRFTAQDLEQVKRGGWWVPGMWKESPDKKLWKSTCPSAQMSIEFSGNAQSLNSAEICTFTFYQFVEKFTASHNLSAKEIPKSIQDFAIKDGRLSFKSKGSEELFGAHYSWDLSISSTIVDVK